MATRDIVTDLANILHPIPTVPADADEHTADGIDAWADEVRHDREEFEHNTQLAWEDGDREPLLGEIAAARREMLAAEKRMRLLVAYAREFVTPRPYRLEDLAQAAGMSISGVRTAYDDDEINEVAKFTGLRRRTRESA